MGTDLTLLPVQVANNLALAELFETGGFGTPDIPFLEGLEDPRVEVYTQALRRKDRAQFLELGRALAQSLRNNGPSLFGDKTAVLKKARAVIGGRTGEKSEYELGRLIAVGGHSSVFLATRRGDGKRVVIKVLHRSGMKNRFVLRGFGMEQKILATLRHPSLPKVFGWGEDLEKVTGDRRFQKLPFIVMEKIRGQELFRLLPYKEFFSWRETKTVVLKLADLLGMLHHGGIVYRDLKPENIFLIFDGEKIAGVKLIDFGFVLNLHDAGERYRQRGTLVGTPPYMAPEQVLASPKQDGRVDIYGLGTLMFHLLTGRPPFIGANNYETMFHHVREPVPLLRDVNPGLRLPKCAQDIVLKAMAKNPAHRFQTMAEMAQAIKECK